MSDQEKKDRLLILLGELRAASFTLGLYWCDDSPSAEEAIKLARKKIDDIFEEILTEQPDM